MNGARYNLWDTRGLGEARKFSVKAIFRRSSEKELKKFIQERHHRHELDLLVYCVRGSRASAASERYYKSICATTRRLFAPVVVVATHLERERDMEDWWNRNSPSLEALDMEFDGHACVTILAGHPQLAKSKERLVDLITRNRRWDGASRGSLSQRSIPPAPPRQGGISGVFKPSDVGDAGNRGLGRRPSNYSGPSSSTSSSRNSAYYTPAESPRESVPPGPIEPPTPSTVTTWTRLSYTDTGFVGASDPTHSPSEETSSTQSSLDSMRYPRCAIMTYFKHPDLENA